MQRAPGPYLARPILARAIRKADLSRCGAVLLTSHGARSSLNLDTAHANSDLPFFGSRFSS